MAKSKKKKSRSTSTTSPFDAFKKDFPPALLEELSNPPKPIGEDANANVVHVLLHKEDRPYWDNLYKVKGVFSSVSPANQHAPKILKREYPEFFSTEENWDQFYPLGRNGLNEIVWKLSKWGGLTVEIQGGGGRGGVYQVYVETHVILNDTPELAGNWLSLSPNLRLSFSLSFSLSLSLLRNGS